METGFLEFLDNSNQTEVVYVGFASLSRGLQFYPFSNSRFIEPIFVSHRGEIEKSRLHRNNKILVYEGLVIDIIEEAELIEDTSCMVS